MIMITGDTHCPIDINKLRTINPKSFGLDREFTKDDYLIICGDGGFVWCNRDDEDEYWQDWISKRPWTTLYVDGNHENHDLLDSMPIEEWRGGKIHRINDSLFHLMRGQVFEIDEKKIFTMGGAASHDKQWRIEGESWWAREMPSKEEYNEAFDNLEKHGNEVDYIISHCGPASVIKKCRRHDESDELTRFFDIILQNIKYKEWYFGHYHEDRALNNNCNVLYYSIHKID